MTAYFFVFFEPSPPIFGKAMMLLFCQFLTPTPKGTANVLNGRPLNQIILIQN